MYDLCSDFDFFEFDHRPSVDFGVIIFSRGQYEDPEPNENEIRIPGMNGVLHTWDGTFSDVSIKYSVMIRGDDPFAIREQIERFRSWLLSKRGYFRLEDTLNPNYYRMAIYKGRSDVVYSQNEKMGKLEVEFQCKPQKFLKNGDIAVIPPSSSFMIYNSTDFDAKPLIKVTGSGTITIAGTSVVLVGISDEEEINIDCELQEVPGYNDKTTLPNGKFPVIPPEASRVSYSGFEQVEIYPRWWTL